MCYILEENMAVCIPHPVFRIAVVLLLGDFFLFTTVFGVLIQTIFALRKAGKADVTFVESAFSSSFPLSNEA